MTHPPLRLGTRSSNLALVQANWVAGQLQAAGHEVELVRIATRGDQTTAPLAQAGEIGLFTKAIQNALLTGEVDVAVHSLKDLPTDDVPGLRLIAFPEREQVHDVLVSPDGRSLDDLSDGCRVGTGSVRRRAQLLYARSGLRVENIRGNVDTRLEKLAAGEFDAIVLAEAGLRRLNRFDTNCWRIPIDRMLPAVGQGALGIEIRSDDRSVAGRVVGLNCQSVQDAVTAERSLLKALTAGCLAPVGANAVVVDGRLQLSAAVFSADGVTKLDGSDSGDASEAIQIGERLADRLFKMGAGPLIDAARSRDS